MAKDLQDYLYYETELGKLYHSDCLEILKEMPDNSIDMILCDLPYGTTACSWDTIIPFEPLWKEYKRLIVDNGAIVLTGSQPFTTDLINSNREWLKYVWFWNKIMIGNCMTAKKMPLRIIEEICVFYKNHGIYNPQLQKQKLSHIRRNKIKLKSKSNVYKNDFSYTRHEQREIPIDMTYPKNYLEFSKGQDRKDHPTQKPVALFEYLIKTYTNEKMTVLDNCIGSGTTAIACEKLNRKWIGIEKEEKYCKIAKQRIKNEYDKMKLDFNI